MAKEADNSSLLSDSFEEINSYHANAYVPVVVFVAAVIVIGITGNAFAFLFHYKKASKSTVYLIITTLSFNDGLTNVFLIHDTIILFNYVNYSNNVLCKFAYFIKHWLVGNSILLLVVIALDRYRRICRPFSKQITQRISCYIVLGIIIFSFLTSLHYFYTGESVPLNWFKRPGIQGFGYLCFLPSVYPQATVNLVFQVVDIFMTVLSFGCLIICYTQVLRKIVKTRQKVILNKLKKGNAEGESSEQHNVSVIHNPEKDIEETKDETGLRRENTTEAQANSTEDKNETLNNDTSKEIVTIKDGMNTERKKKINREMETSIVDGNVIWHKNTSKENETTQSKTDVHSSEPSNSMVQKGDHLKKNTFKLCKAEKRISKMTFVLTVASIISFVPYFISVPFRPNLDGTTLVVSVAVAFARRSYILNSTVNPYIMLYFNTEFRQYVVNAIRCACLRR